VGTAPTAPTAAADRADELELAFRLADRADAVSLPQFRSEELLQQHKSDGTPVSQIDLDVEQAMFDLVRAEAPSDHVLGEEIGDHPGTSGRRWIFDGIDGTHNYALGRAGWGTAISCLVDGVVVAGVVSCPAFGRRVWATAGGGAWRAPFVDGVARRADAVRLHCSTATTLDEAVIAVMPWEGLLVGWRNEVSKRFPLAPEHRSQSIVLDIVAVAAGELDVSVLTLGEPWDYTGTSLIVTEAGGTFRDAWGGTRFDTNTLVCTNPTLIEPMLDALADLRPEVPDRARLARIMSEPIGTPDEQAVDPWRAFGVRPMPSMSAREPVHNAPPEVANIVDERAAELDRPFVGVTTDGVARPGLRSLDDAPKVDTRPIAAAADTFLEALTADQRVRAEHPLASVEWRTWLNVHMNHFRHGILLEELPMATRELALDIVRATLSVRGYDQARTIMRINALLAEISGDWRAFGEWPYFLTIFGRPDAGEPWGWQLDGHHLCLNALVIDGRLVLTPAFMGAEPRDINSGPLAGTLLFGPEEGTGLALIRSLDAGQRDRAIIHPSIHEHDISPLLQNGFDGRMLAGAFHDNAVLPYQGVVGTDLTEPQRRLLLDVATSYVGWSSDPHAEVRLDEVVAHLDETWFSWYGGYDDVEPFYYRVHSPVILIEFDHHPGVVLDNDSPTRHHVHTVVRTPNGGDYGTDLLAEHHARFDHTTGHHIPRM
jgi:fructose-1,6-bisphosphatase/inositol monophosphatase family enzyme